MSILNLILTYKHLDPLELSRVLFNSLSHTSSSKDIGLFSDFQRDLFHSLTDTDQKIQFVESFKEDCFIKCKCSYSKFSALVMELAYYTNEVWATFGKDIITESVQFLLNYNFQLNEEVTDDIVPCHLFVHCNLINHLIELRKKLGGSDLFMSETPAVVPFFEQLQRLFFEAKSRNVLTLLGTTLANWIEWFSGNTSLMCQLRYSFINFMKQHQDQGLNHFQSVVSAISLLSYIFKLIVVKEDVLMKTEDCQLIRMILHNGLASEDSATRKLTTFILKRYLFLIHESEQEHNHSQYEIVKEGRDFWQTFFLVYEGVQENGVHLIEPLLPKLNYLIEQETNLNEKKWWSLVFVRGFRNDSIPIRKRLLDFIVSTESQKILKIIAGNHDFLFNIFLPTIDNTSLFSICGNGTSSVFGEKMSNFFARLIMSGLDENFAKELLVYAVKNIKKFVPLIYLLEGISKAATSVKFMEDKEVTYLEYLIHHHPNVLKQSDQTLMRKVCLHLFSEATIPRNISFSSLSSFISTIFSEKLLFHDKTLQRLMYQWLQLNNTEKDNSVVLLADNISIFINSLLNEDISPETTKHKAISISFFANLMIDKHQEQLERGLMPLFNILESLYGRPYISSIHVGNAFLIYSTLFERAEDIQKCFKNVQPAVLMYFEVSVFHFHDQFQELVYLESYARSVEAVLSTSSLQQIQDFAIKYFNGFATIKTKDSENRNIDLFGGILDMLISKSIVKSISKPTKEIDAALNSLFAHVIEWNWRKPKDFPATLKWNEVYSYSNNIKWELLNLLVQNFIQGKSNVRDEEMEKWLLEMRNELGSPLPKTLELLLAQFTLLAEYSSSIDENLMISVSETTFNVVQEYISDPKSLYPLIESYCKFFLHSNILLKDHCISPDGWVTKDLKRMIDIGIKKPGILNEATKQLLQVWPKCREQCIKLFQNSPDIVIDLVVFGPPRDRDDLKLDRVMVQKWLKCYNDVLEEDNRGSYEFGQKDFAVRVHINSLLANLDSNQSKEVGFANFVIDTLLEHNKIQEVKAGVGIQHTEYHRSKIRIWSTLLLLLPFWKTEKLQNRFEELLKAIQQESLVSVRYYMECILSRLIQDDSSLQEEYLKELGKFNAKSHLAISLLTVSMHLAHTESSISMNWLQQLLCKVEPWIASHHYIIRTFAQWSFKELATKLNSNGVSKLNANHQMSLSFINENNDCTKALTKCTDFYLFQKYSESDFNLHFIFWYLPKLGEVEDSEWISEKAFIKTGLSFYIPLKGETSTVPSQTLTSSIESMPPPQYQDNSTILQKKTLPWEKMLDAGDLDLSRDTGPLGKKTKLVIVASLLSRIPNLAGLCRSAEIFGASTLVLDNKKMIYDEKFKSISVNSERWIDVQEVKEANIGSYLMDMKEMGYSIVGVEQATDSKSLESFSFPEKTVLLLGNEKEGVPAGLLNLLDITVEIPQLGLTRSLNVHVSGALFIWEYTKQFMERM